MHEIVYEMGLSDVWKLKPIPDRYYAAGSADLTSVLTSTFEALSTQYR